jgi:hypothetical protein
MKRLEAAQISGNITLKFMIFTVTQILEQKIALESSKV